jgi:hypothetical protein
MRAADLIPGFLPETDLERAVCDDPALIAGLDWGQPWCGLPEGKVGAHVAELLSKIDYEGYTGANRAKLRLIALVHDSFKYRVNQTHPKIGENHHAMRARRFAQRYTDDELTLAIIELHDKPYAIWRRMRRTGYTDGQAIAQTLERIQDWHLFMWFVELDGSTEGKNPEPVRWFRNEILKVSPDVADAAYLG